MEWINYIKERYSSARQKDITKEAERVISLRDFNNNIFIAINNVPLIQMNEESTPQTILTNLTTIRQNYINAMTSNN